MSFEESLNDAVEWRQRLWTPVVRGLIGDQARWQGRRVLELGCRRGGMSTLFAELGAEVTGVDVEDRFFAEARDHSTSAGVADRVRFVRYDGTPDNLPEGPFDIVFSKSVLVIVPDLRETLTAIRSRLAPGGELLAAENAAPTGVTGAAVSAVRRRVLHRRWDFERFSGVDDAFLATTREIFDDVDVARRLGLVVGITARSSVG